jgi:signal transduction histidine kinase
MVDDMTALQDSEEEQRHGGAARLRQAVEASPIGIAFWGAGGALSDANDSFCAITGYARADVVAGVVNWSPMMTGIPDAGVCPLREEEFVRADGVRIPVLIAHVRLGTAPEQGVSYVLDLSVQKRTEEQSRQADKTQAVVQLAGGIAHDFNNLLMTILGNSEMLTAKLDAKGPLHEMAALIEEAAQRAADLTRRLLAVARRQPLRPQAVDVDRLAAGLLERLRGILGDSIAIELSSRRDLPQAMADPAALETAILNLAVNAGEAMPNGGRLLIEAGIAQVDEVRARQLGDIRPRRYVTISLADNGTGMPPEVAKRAFDPFFSTKRGGKGRGLGLGTVEGFARQSAGCVALASTPGKGTTATIYLTAAEPS